MYNIIYSIYIYIFLAVFLNSYISVGFQLHTVEETLVIV